MNGVTFHVAGLDWLSGDAAAACGRPNGALFQSPEVLAEHRKVVEAKLVEAEDAQRKAEVNEAAIVAKAEQAAAAVAIGDASVAELRAEEARLRLAKYVLTRCYRLMVVCCREMWVRGGGWAHRARLMFPECSWSANPGHCSPRRRLPCLPMQQGRRFQVGNDTSRDVEL